MKRKIICLTLGLLLFSGCWDRRELNTLLYVSGLGLDTSDLGIKLSAQASDINAQSSSDQKEGGKSSSYITIEAEGQTINDALRELTHNTARSVFLYQDNVVIFGKDLAEQGIDKYLDYIARDRELRMDVFILVSRTTAGEVLNADLSLETLPSAGMVNMIGIQKQTGSSYPLTLRDMISSIISGTTSPVAMMIEKGMNGENETLVMSGMAVFDKGKMIGELTPYESSGFMWIQSAPQARQISVPAGRLTGNLTIDVVSKEVTAQMKNGKPAVKIELAVRGSLVELLDEDGDADMEHTLNLFQIACKRAIEEEMKACVKKSKELKADIFGFGEKFYKHMPKEWKEMKDDWKEIFANLEIDYSIDCKVLNTGLLNDRIREEKK